MCHEEFPVTERSKDPLTRIEVQGQPHESLISPPDHHPRPGRNEARCVVISTRDRGDAGEGLAAKPKERPTDLEVADLARRIGEG
jgi:hypothetical protein